MWNFESERPAVLATITMSNTISMYIYIYIYGSAIVRKCLHIHIECFGYKFWLEWNHSIALQWSSTNIAVAIVVAPTLIVLFIRLCVCVCACEINSDKNKDLNDDKKEEEKKTSCFFY